MDATTICEPIRLRGCTVVRHHLGAASVTASHTVDRPLLAVAIDGTCETELEGQHLGTDCGSAWTEPAGARRVNRAGRGGARVFSVVPDLVATDTPFAPFRSLFARPVVVRSALVGREALRAWAACDETDSVAPAAVLGSVLLLLSEVARAERGERCASRRPGWIAIARDFIHARFRDPLDLETIAAEAAVTPTHLTRAFRAHLGVTPAEYARALRVTWAAEQLGASDAAIVEIASAAGFVDQSHFTREFRRQTGTTPAAYRRAARIMKRR